MPKLSVIIPVYNAGKYIRECLDSIINQTLKDIEIICVDDRSTDNSLKIIEEYAKNDNRIIILNNNGIGAGGGRNTGLKKATGEYLSFLDADDFFELNMLEEMYLKAQNTDSDIVICNAKKFYTNNNTYSNYGIDIIPDEIKQYEVFNYKNIPEKIFTYFSSVTWNKIYKNDFIKKHQIEYQEIPRSNDLFFVRAALVSAERISWIDKYFVNYRVGLSTNLQSNNVKTPIDFIKALYELKDYLIKKNLYDELQIGLKNSALFYSQYYISTLKTYPINYLKLVNYINKTLVKDFKFDLNINYFKLFLNFIFSIRKFRGTEYKIINFLGIRFKIRRKEL